LLACYVATEFKRAKDNTIAFIRSKNSIQGVRKTFFGYIDLMEMTPEDLAQGRRAN